MAEHLLLFIHPMTTVLLKCLGGWKFHTLERNILLHQFHHPVFQSSGQRFRHSVVQSVQSAVFAAGDGVQDSQFHPRKDVLNRLEKKKIERTAIHRIPINGRDVKKVDLRRFVDAVGQVADLVVDQSPQNGVLQLHIL